MSGIWNGIYAVYMTGVEGQGFAMMLFQNGVLTGADPLGVLFDGKYEVADDQSLDGMLRVTVPGGATTIQGASFGPDGFAYEVHLHIEDVARKGGYFNVVTPLGNVNVRLELLRALGDEN